ncbi:ankyrin repeat domain-containing protein 40-like [Diadema antillarum]|uniref:ankyrin repeat domain-containing protein 40-like n=1 Tax=Diadema antillarum TaxID=105358 RepID=UPI003A8BD876
MDNQNVIEEKLRESSSIGDRDGIEDCLGQGADVNSQNKMNGWTALHWASKRGHPTIVRYLLSRGADVSIATQKGELAVQLTDSEDVRNILAGTSEPGSAVIKTEALPITPNYLKNPVFPHGASRGLKSGGQHMANGLPPGQSGSAVDSADELVLKVRVAESAEKDFIEVELPRNALTFENLVQLCCGELMVEPSEVTKIRKLPNTIVRKDKDVLRLQDFQELELVTKKRPPFGATPYTVPVHNLLY